MNVLLLGDEHTYGYGLPGRHLSYVGHFIRQISRAGRAVSVDAYAHLTAAEVLNLLTRLPLNRYDLILLQFSSDWLSRPSRFGHPAANRRTGRAPVPPLAEPDSLSWLGRLGATAAEWVAFRSVNALWWMRKPTPHCLALLRLLRPFRHNVLLLTPFPELTPASQWQHRRSRATLLREGYNQLFSVFDTDQVVRPREEYFLKNDPRHLNAVSHELMGHALFEFYQSAPTIVTIPTFRRS